MRCTDTGVKLLFLVIRFDASPSSSWQSCWLHFCSDQTSCFCYHCLVFKYGYMTAEQVHALLDPSSKYSLQVTNKEESFWTRRHKSSRRRSIDRSMPKKLTMASNNRCKPATGCQLWWIVQNGNKIEQSRLGWRQDESSSAIVSGLLVEICPPRNSTRTARGSGQTNLTVLLTFSFSLSFSFKTTNSQQLCQDYILSEARRCCGRFWNDIHSLVEFPSRVGSVVLWVADPDGCVGTSRKDTSSSIGAFWWASRFMFLDLDEFQHRG